MKEEIITFGGIRFTTIENKWKWQSDGSREHWIDCINPMEIEMLNEIQRLRTVEQQTDTAPLYYILRRTVGKTTLHYQYAYGPDFSVRVYASTSLADARIFETMKEAQEASAYCPGSEILSIRLLVGGVE